MSETTAEKKARLQRELAEVEATETHEFQLKLRTILTTVIGLLPAREDQQAFRNLLTEHIKSTYDADDE